MSRYHFGAVLLAAGQSVRFGTGDKLLAPYDGKPLLAHALDVLLGLDLDQRVVVMGPDAPGVEALLGGAPVEIVVNPDIRGGMGTSIAAGAAALRPEIDAVLVLLGDMPRVTVADATAVLTAFDPAAGKTMVVPVHRKQRGHPVLFGRDQFPALVGLTGDHGARPILSSAPGRVVEVATANPGILVDCDTPEDLASA